MLKRFRCSFLVSVLLAGDVLAATTETSRLDDAVKMARAGQYDQALPLLRELADRADGRRAQYDLIVVLDWAGKYSESLDRWLGLSDQGSAPVYVRSAVMDALLRSGQTSAAIDLAKQAVGTHPREAQYWVLLGKAHEAANKPFEALYAYARAQRLDPQDEGARLGLARELSSLGAPNGAIFASQQATPALQAKRAAVSVRWAENIAPLSSKETFDRIDKALADLDHLIEIEREKAPLNKNLLIELMGDRAVALRQRQKWQMALDQVDAVRQLGPVRSYVRHAEADALLALRRPELARLGYLEVLVVEPKNRDARLGLIFAEADCDHPDAAISLADEMAAELSTWKYFPKIIQPTPNDDWLDSQLMAALIRSWSDMPDQAWDRILPLVQGAPASVHLRLALGSVAAARDWPRRSDQEIKIAESLEPANKSVQIALAESATRRADWSRARDILTDLSATYPDDLAVKRLARDYSHHDQYELHVEFVNQDQSGAALAAPGSGYVASSRLYSPTLADRWRMVIQTDKMMTTVPEGGVAVRNRFGAGAEYRTGDLTVESLVWQNTGNINALGASVQASWQPTDHWGFSAGLEQYAADTPLRAIYNGTTSNSLNLSTTYTWNESQSARLLYKPSLFTDGNSRQMVNASYSQRVINRPGFNLTLTPSLYASSNSSQDVSYFSPSSDFAANLSAKAEGILYRRYDQVFGHRLIAGVGMYQQNGYATGLINDVSYEQFYRPDSDYEFKYGAGMTRRIYDGVPEDSYILYFQMVAKF